MANITFSKTQSALINSGRVQVSFNGNAGDTFAMLLAYGDTTNYNNIVTAYNSLEQQIDDTIAAGYSCFGTDQDNVQYPIYSKPSGNRPHPHTI